jgi:hypothetical protein
MVDVIFRSTHILGVVMLLGRALAITWGGMQPGETKRPYVIGAVVMILSSGFWQLVRIMQQGVPSHWHMVFGIKFLLALHVLGVALFSLRPSLDAAKRKRMVTGAAYSGLVIVILSATLRLYDSLQ